MIEIPIKLEFTLSIVEPLDDIDAAEIKQHLEYIIPGTYYDNHPPFYVEMLHRGLHECVGKALQDAIETREQNRDGGRDVIKLKNGSVSRWVGKSLRAYRRLKWWLSSTHVEGVKH